MDGWMNGWMDGWMDGYIIFPRTLNTLKSLKRSTIKEKVLY